MEKIEHANPARESNIMESAEGQMEGVSMRPPAFQLMADSLAHDAPALQLAADHTAPIQREPDLTTGKDKFVANQDYFDNYTDANAGFTKIVTNDKVGTFGMGPCCAMIVACHIKDAQNNNRWTVGLHHYSGANQTSTFHGGDYTPEVAYKQLIKDTEAEAVKQGTIQHTYKYLIPGTSTQGTHGPAIKKLEKDMMEKEGKAAFDNDWESICAEYAKKSNAIAQNTDKHGKPKEQSVYGIAVTIKPGYFKKSNLYITQHYQRRPKGI